MPYHIEVECSAAHGTAKPDWRAVRPTRGDPYRYDTQEAAEHDMHLCYPNLVLAEQVRVREVAP